MGKVRTPSIEDIILSYDRRGISALRSYLPADYCDEAANYVLASRNKERSLALITTGFYIIRGNSAETDGPPGAVAIGKALLNVGCDVVYVTDKYALPLFPADFIGNDRVIEFPIADEAKSHEFAGNLLKELIPSLIISTERCGASASGKYLNMRLRDISEFTAKIDYLFNGSCKTIGIGDGGNEIGMGNLADFIPQFQTLTPEPPVAKVDKLIIASVSNWGAYGLIAALSLLVNKNLLPEIEWEKDFIRELVGRGAVDGTNGDNKPTVDGFDLEQNARTLTELHEYVKARIGKDV